MTRPVEMLSGGQRQVVALARSAIRVNGESQGILLLDEPTAALGYEQTKNVEALIRRMADQGIAIVIVTHDLPLCYEVADRIVILNRGKKVADVPAAGTDRDHVVGWITGSKASMFADRRRSEPCRSTMRSRPASRSSTASPRSRRRWPTRRRTGGCASSWSRRSTLRAVVPTRDLTVDGPHGPVPVRVYGDRGPGHRSARTAVDPRRRVHVRRPRHARGRLDRARGLRPDRRGRRERRLPARGRRRAPPGAARRLRGGDPLAARLRRGARRRPGPHHRGRRQRRRQPGRGRGAPAPRRGRLAAGRAASPSTRCCTPPSRSRRPRWRRCSTRCRPRCGSPRRARPA